MNVRRFVIPALLGMLLAVLFAAAPARADATPQQAADVLRTRPVFVTSEARDQLPQGSTDELRSVTERANTPVFVAILPKSQESQVRSFTQQLVQQVQRSGTYAVLAGDEFYAMSDVLSSGTVTELAKEADASGGRPVEKVTDFVTLVNNEATGSGSDGGGGAMASTITLLVVIAVLFGGLGGVYLVARNRRRQREERQLAEVRQAASEDVTQLGEDITSLDLDVRSAELESDTRENYQRALDSYDRAKGALEAANKPEDLRPVTQALEDGRYEMTCVRALLAGEPVPERRAPCFFNPQHGPSTTDMRWAPQGGTPRPVPVCAADARRLAQGQDPEARYVDVNGRRRPYWEGGPAYAPWAGGYYHGFGGMDMLSGVLVGTMLGSMITPGFGMGGDFGGDFGGGGADFGGGGGFDFGDFGGGGMDF